MDAFQYEIYRAQLCTMYNGFCAACPLNSDGKSIGCVLCNYDTIKVIERTQKLIDWAEKWPRTRQDAFERYFSDVPMKNGIINICPKKIDKSYKTKCVRDCRILCIFVSYKVLHAHLPWQNIFFHPPAEYILPCAAHHPVSVQLSARSALIKHPVKGLYV